ncbi:MAG: hypothetical protein KatS3mg003_1191 [Candidatus Nitrosocaldaceae archaeon]|nr:MAG: hypothetical protein KatS3mg003_1191 [Candidatus Nitrosocaldaceae archaeon]
MSTQVINAPVVIKSVIIVAAIILLYWYDLSLVFSKALTFSAGNLTNYILLIPLLILFVLYRKRYVLVALSSITSRKNLKLEILIGITLCALAIFIYIIGSSTLYAAEYHMYSLPLFVAGSTTLLFNLKVLRQLFFVLIILIYLQPPPGELVTDLAADLSWISASMTESFLSTFGMPISLETSYGAPALVVEKDGSKIPFYVGEPSSGVYSIIGLSLFGLFVAYLVKGEFWKRLSIFGIGFPVFFILNVFRIIIILVLWYNYGLDVSEAFHAVSGIVMVSIGSIALLLFSDKVMKMNVRIINVRKAVCNTCHEYKQLGEYFCLLCGRFLNGVTKISTKDYTRIAFIALILISGISLKEYTSANALLSNENNTDNNTITELDISTIEGPETTKYFLPNIEGWDLQYAYRDKRIESVLNQDAALSYRYIKNGTNDINPTIYAGIQISTGRHAWESSLVVQPSRVGRPSAEVIELTNIEISESQIGRLFIYKRPGSNLTEAVLYWFERVPLRFGQNFESRNVQIVLWSYADNLVRSGLINSTTDVDAIRELYLSLARPIDKHWSTTFVSLVQERISETLISYSPLVAFMISIPALAFTLNTYNTTKKANHMIYRLYSRLASDDKMLIDAVRAAKPPTTENILREYIRISGKNISYKEILDKLMLASDNDLLNKDVINIDDEPRFVWKVIEYNNDNNRSNILE